MFWFVENLAKQSMRTGVLPWDFKLETEISKQIRHDKNARQNWYRNAGTIHHFYTPLEPANPNMRPSKDNPPRAIHAFAADYDLPIPAQRVDEAIAAMKFKPAYVERSLGGNVRLVWLLPRPILVETYDFCCFVLEKAMKWLELDLLPGLDESAFTTPTRLLCNGADWKSTGFKPIPEAEVQAFFVSCGKEFNFKGGDGALIPLDVIEAKLKETYPSFNWPGDFSPDTQGPTFWIPESTSPLSAILKPEGLITFAAHAIKPFYSWADLLGVEFVRQFHVESISKATNDVWWDGKRFWRRKGAKAHYKSLEASELTNFFQVQCRLSTKPASDGISPVATALNHIYDSNFVDGAAPFVFRPSGPVDFMGKRILNTYSGGVLQPATEPQEWAVNFPFLAALFDNMFDPAPQKEWFLAWWKHFYESGLNLTPLPGQNIFLMGGAGIGKTLANREIIGRSVGAHTDASDFLIKGAPFNSELFESPLWCVDDEQAGDSESSRQSFQSMLKKVTANQTFKHNKKFEVATMTEWMGRVVCTTNLDFVSSRLLGSMDNTSADKTSIFRCAAESKIVFPPRQKVIETINTELPCLLRWLVDWTPPLDIPRNPRYGYGSYHEPSLLSNAKQGSKSAPFKELLVEALQNYFRDNPEAESFKGSVTKIIRMLHLNPLNDSVLRTLRLEQTSRYLEAIQREGQLKCEVVSGDMDERIWVFKKL
jgi:hypothetical protein